MKLKNILLFITLLIFAITLFANTNPVVSNVAFTINGTTVTVTYDVADAEQTSVTIQIYVSQNSGGVWVDKTNEATGDKGNVSVTATPTQKTIGWVYTGSSSSTMKIKIIANDETADGSPCAGMEKVYYEGGPNNDGDGNGDYYNTIKIGNQCWLKENLNVGTMINGSTNATNNNSIEKYCYNNLESNCDIYGGLYQWNEAMQYSSTEGTQGICPNGWKTPSYDELLTLRDAVNGSANSLKSGSNTSGFTALPAGYRYHTNGSFRNLGIHYDIWSSTVTSGTAYYINLYSYYDTIYFHRTSKNKGYGVRCIKN